MTSCKNNPAIWFPAIRTGTGTDRFTERLVQALQKRNIEADVTWLPHRAEYAPWTVTVPKPPKWASIVHINSWLHTRFVPNNLPLVVTLHSCVHDDALSPYKTTLQRLYHRYWVKTLEKRALKRADATTAVSRYTAKQAQKQFDCSKITPIYNWVDTTTFRPGEQNRTHRPFRLIYVGSLRRSKGSDILATVMRRLGPDFELRYTGNPDDFPEPSALPDNMIPLGRLHGDAALVAAYQDCDALFFPTRLEGFGLVVTEAMACGLPVISSNNTALPEIIPDQDHGVLCPTDDIDCFVSSARRLAKMDGREWTRIRHKAIKRVNEAFSEDSAIIKYIEIYQNAIKSNRS